MVMYILNMSLPYKLNSVLEMIDRDVSNIKVNQNIYMPTSINILLYIK